MPFSAESLFKLRNFPFFFALSVLLICFTILLFTNNDATINTIVYSSDVQSQPRSQPSSPVLEDSNREEELLREETPTTEPDNPELGGKGNPITEPKDVELPRIEKPISEPKDVKLTRIEKPSTELKDEELVQKEETFKMDWKLCKGAVSVDYIPCLDNLKAIRALKTRRHMEHRERHCPKPNPRCLVGLPKGYKVPVPWPKSRDMIWYHNVPRTKLLEYKKDQNWVVKSGKYLVFPGGGTQFKQGVDHYIDFIEKTLPSIQWGKNIRVILDVGCGVASFGGHLLDKNVITMSFAPKDEHEAQIQFALERGIPATLSVIGTQKLTFPNNGFDLLHCARCRVHWDADGGKPLFELNRILRPGGFFVWSTTPVYRDSERDQKVWKSMVSVTTSMCWKMVAKTMDSTGIGLVIYQKPTSSSCYEKRKKNNPPFCELKDVKNISWYARFSGCLSPLPVDSTGNVQSWPMPWPRRLTSRPPSLSTESDAIDMFYKDSKHLSELVSDVYVDGLSINWSSVRNVMDMNAGYGGFATALTDLPVWVMNVVPIGEPDTLTVIFDRGLIGMYHDWCESFNTYPRTYDLLHASFLFKILVQRCDIVDVVVEMDRILRPNGYLLVRDSMEIIGKLSPILRSLHWSVSLYQNQYLVGRKSFWRPRAES